MAKSKKDSGATRRLDVMGGAGRGTGSGQGEKSGQKAKRSIRTSDPLSSEGSIEASGLIAPLRLAFSAILLLQLFAAFLPGTLFWGVNHLAYTGRPLSLLWPLLGLLLIWTTAGERVGRWLVQRAAPVLIWRNFVAYLVVPCLGGGLFWLLRCRMHFLGDGWLLGEMVHKGVMFHGYDFIDYHLHARLFEILGLTTEQNAFTLFAVISVIAGSIFLASVVWASRRISEDIGEQLLFYLLMVISSPVQMFMGYVECYSLLAIFMVLFLAALAMHYRNGMSITIPGTMLGLALMFHLDTLFLAPIFLVVLFKRAPNAPESVVSRFIRAGMPIVALMIAAVVIYLIAGYNRERYELDFVAGRRLQRIFTWFSGPHGFFSWTHWKDFLNLHLLLAGVPLAGVIVLISRFRRVKKPPVELIIMGIGTVWLMILISVLHMKLGVVRDWDLFAAQAPVYCLLFFLVISFLAKGRPGAHLIGMIFITLFIFVTPWFYLNAGTERSLARFHGVITDLPRFGQAYAHEEIGKYYRKTDQIDKALAEYRECSIIFPENARFHAVLAALQYNNGDQESAFDTFHKVLEADSTYALGLEMLARIHNERGEPRKTLEYSRKLSGQGEHTLPSAILYGSVAMNHGFIEEAREAYTEAYRIDPGTIELVDRIGVTYLMQENFVMAERAFREVVKRKPEIISSRIGLVIALWQPVSGDETLWREEGVRERLDEARGLINSLIADGEATEDIKQWKLDIDAILDQ